MSAVTFKVFEPFPRPQPGGMRHFVIYVFYDGGQARRRCGSVDLRQGIEAETWLQSIREQGWEETNATALGLPEPAKTGP